MHALLAHLVQGILAGPSTQIEAYKLDLRLFVTPEIKDKTVFPFVNVVVHRQTIHLVCMVNNVLHSALEADFYSIKSRESHVMYLSKVDSTGITGPSIAHLVKQFVQYFQEHCSYFWLFVFARAAPSYIFKAETPFSQKKVLDDAGLLKWWSRLLSSLEASFHGRFVPNDAGLRIFKGETKVWGTLFPKQAMSPVLDKRIDELKLSCIIPYFRDDAKRRFMDDLGEQELEESALNSVNHQTEEHAIEDKSRTKTQMSRDMQHKIDQMSMQEFLLLLEQRQECAQRLTGFFTVVSRANEQNTSTEFKLMPNIEQNQLSRIITTIYAASHSSLEQITESSKTFERTLSVTMDISESDAIGDVRPTLAASVNIEKPFMEVRESAIPSAMPVNTLKPRKKPKTSSTS